MAFVIPNWTNHSNKYYVNDDTDVPSTQQEEFVAVAVREHNIYRDIHGVPDVASFSADINNFAQHWAEHLASSNQFYHSSGSGFGENLFMSWGGSSDRNIIMQNAIRMFYDEIEFYDWNNPGFSPETGHFTQVVWRASTEIGVGISVHPDPSFGHRAVVSINYRPPGNFLGQFPQNVPPPRFRSLDLTRTFLHDDEKPAKVMIL